MRDVPPPPVHRQDPTGHRRTTSEPTADRSPSASANGWPPPRLDAWPAPGLGPAADQDPERDEATSQLPLVATSTTTVLPLPTRSVSDPSPAVAPPGVGPPGEPPSSVTSTLSVTGALPLSLEPQPTAEVPAVGAGWSAGYEEPPAFLPEESWPGRDEPPPAIPFASAPLSLAGPTSDGTGLAARATDLFERWPGLAALGFAAFLIVVISLAFVNRADPDSGEETANSGSLFQRSGVAPSPDNQPPVAEATTSTTAATTTTLVTTTTVPSTTTTATTLPVDTYPQAVADEVTTERRAMIDVLSNDSAGSAPINPGSLRIVTSPQHAQEAFVGLGWVIYKPQRDFEGTDYLEYEICDFNNLCSIAGVTITVDD